MTEEENRAWVVYMRMESYTPDAQLRSSWHDLSDDEQKFYLNLSRHLDMAAQRLASDVDKAVFRKLIDQEYWT